MKRVRQEWSAANTVDGDAKRDKVVASVLFLTPDQCFWSHSVEVTGGSLRRDRRVREEKEETRKK